MCKYCEKHVEIIRENRWVSKKHPHYRIVEEKITHNPIWLTEYVGIDYVGDVPIDVYFDVDTNKLNGKVKINYCPFCGRNL